MKRLTCLCFLLPYLCFFCLNAAAEIEGRVISAAGGISAGVPNVRIRVFRSGALLSSATTDEEGRFSMPLRIAQNCRLYAKLPESAFFSEDGPLTPTQEDGWEGWSEPFSLEEGQILRFPDIVTLPAASVSGRAWEDRDADGLPGPDEAPIKGAYVVLLDMQGDPKAIDSVRIYPSGTYSFPRLREGRYSLAFRLPDGYLFTKALRTAGGSSAAAPGEGQTAVTPAFSLGKGERLTEMNIGGYLPARIGDTVWIDRNGNGLQDYREPAASGVQLSLIGGSGEEIAGAVSDEYGFYCFDGLPPGNYTVRISPPSSFRLTARDSAAPGEIDSDADPDTLQTEPISLIPGDARRNVDFGLIPDAGDR